MDMRNGPRHYKPTLVCSFLMLAVSVCDLYLLFDQVHQAHQEDLGNQEDPKK